MRSTNIWDMTVGYIRERDFERLEDVRQQMS
jgi:hypothetical protein